MNPKTNVAAGLFGGAFALAGIAGVGAAQSLITNDTSYAELTYELAYDGTFITFCFTGQCPGPYANDPGSSAAYTVTAGDARYLFDQTPESWAFETAPADDPDTLFVEARARGDFGVTERAVVRVTNTFEGSASVTLDGTPVFGEFVTMSPGETLSVSFSSGTAQTVGRELRVEVTDLAIPQASVSLLGTFQGHTYYLTDEAVTIHEARSIAAGLAEELALQFNESVYVASVNTAAEDAFLIDSGADSWWVGLSDEVTEGTFVWDNGDAVTYTNWRPGEPNNFQGVEDYTAINRFGTGQWNDLQASDIQRAVIEVNDSSSACFGAGGGGLRWVLSEGDDSGRDTVFADINGDGMPDPVFLTGSRTIIGDAFGGVRFVNSDGFGGFAIEAGDFDADDRTDLVVAWGTVYVWSQQPDGSFIRQNIPGQSGSNIIDVEVADVNGDGHDDFVGLDVENNMVVVGLNDETGAFPTIVRSPVTGANLNQDSAIAISDFDDDGAFDVAVVARNVFVMLGNGDGSFSGEAVLDADQRAFSFIETGDLNADGNPDILAGGMRFGSVFLSTGPNTFAPRIELRLPGGAENHRFGGILDSDGDGDNDVVLSRSNRGPVAFLNVGNDTFQYADVFPADDIDQRTQLSVADIDGDGDTDLLIAGRTSNAILQAWTGYLYRNRSCPADLNNDCLADLTDIDLFIAAFLAQGAGADLAAPFGIIDLSDVDDFVNGFVSGCQ